MKYDAYKLRSSKDASLWQQARKYARERIDPTDGVMFARLRDAYLAGYAQARKDAGYRS